jgi:hypothetical protein
MGLFSCQFCVENDTDCITCYDLENSASNSAANEALTDLGEGTYVYRATASLDGVPMAPITGFFRTGRSLFYFMYHVCCTLHMYNRKMRFETHMQFFNL